MKILFTSIVLFVSFLCFSQQIEIRPVIDNIIVYNSSAEVICKNDISIKTGNSKIKVSSLTPFIVENTIKVSFESKNIEIIRVTEQINHLQKKASNDTLVNAYKDSLSKISEKYDLVINRIHSKQKERDLLFKNESIGGVANGVNVVEIEKAADFFSKRHEKLGEEIYFLERESKHLNERILAFTNQLNNLSSNEVLAGSEVTIYINAKENLNGKLTLKFLTSKAGWSPVYDCKYTGQNNPIEFVFNANVFNATGTNWQDVNMALSTATPTKGFSAPNLDTENTIKGSVENINYKTIQVSNAIATYPISHKQSIPSDSKPYLVAVDRYSMQSNYNYLVIPKLDPYGFLMAKISDWNKYNLLPGTTNVYNKGSYMGKTFLNTYTENDTLTVFLGKDNSIRASKEEVIVNNEKKLIGNYYNEKASFKLEIKNNSSESLPIEILDQVPVYTSADNTKFNLQNVADALYNQPEGLLTWQFDLPPNSTKSIAYNYTIKMPKSTYLGGYSKGKRAYRTISCPSF